jgi:hypothetical protein
MSESFVVEKNVKLPISRPRYVAHYPWLTMKPGDSFTVTGRTSAAAARGSFNRYQRMGKIAANLKCLQRQEEGEQNSIRIWLVEA